MNETNIKNALFLDPSWNKSNYLIGIMLNWPVDTGNSVSLLIWDSTQSINRAMYCGAGNWVGFLNLTPSAHRYSNLGPPDIVGQDSSVQKSLTVPYIKLIRLKKSTTVTTNYGCNKLVKNIWKIIYQLYEAN